MSKRMIKILKTMNFLTMATVILFAVCCNAFTISIDTYMVYESGGTYFAKNTVSGANDFSGANAGTVINSAISAGGDGCSIAVTPGIYSIGETIVLRNKVNLHGDKGTILKLTHDGNVISGDGVCDVRIRGLEIWGNRTVYTGRGIELINASCRNVIENLYIHDCGDDGIAFSGETSKQNKIQGNRIEDCLGAGIGLFSSAGDSVISENNITRTRHHGIIISYGGSNCRVTNNTVTNAGQYKRPGDFAHGIAVDGGSGAVHGKNHIITGNTVINPAMAGIEVGDSIDEVVISGNAIQGTGNNHYGIYFGGGNTPGTNATIENNIIAQGDGCGIQIDAPFDTSLGITTNVTISNNTIYECDDHGIALSYRFDWEGHTLGGGQVGSVNIIGNVCANNARDGTGNGIYVNGQSSDKKNFKIEVVGNSCHDDRGTKLQEYGLYLNNVDKVIVSGNSLGKNKNGATFKANVTELLETNNQ